MYPKKSSRWCPTPEQVMILEEMYRGGVKTPKAAQIQAITAHLSHYGKIEGKNVFYWFQNHKARDRQKQRKKLMMSKLNPNQTSMSNGNHFVHPQLYYYVPVPIQPQVDSVNAAQMMIYSVKPSPLSEEKYEKNARSIKRDGHDCFTILEASPENKPLKTLELFPTIPSGDLKIERLTSSQSSSFTSSN